MGYVEKQYTLPRWEDLSISRQTVYDNTFEKPPSMGWMFMPLVNYEGGGPPAWFEPLQQNLEEYTFGMAQYLTAGVAACYRGFRLYDSQQTRNNVKLWVTFYKQYREVLNSDIIHFKRPNMQGLDGFMHTNPSGKIKGTITFITDKFQKYSLGLIVIFNPTSERISKAIKISLYYTGLTKTANISMQSNDLKWSTYTLSRNYEVKLEVSIDKQSLVYFIVK